MTDEQLTALLRLKRYERPPAGYFDRLLEDVHRRQRAELLRQPLWKIAVERVQVFFGEHSMGNVSYAGAMVAALVVGIGAISVLTPEGGKPAGQSSQLTAVVAPSTPSPAENTALVTLQRSGQPLLGRQTFPLVPARSYPQWSTPRQVMDARPASYDPSPSISF